tara:strand:+ start:197 stop:877 length:681 start_codon:yes stop_codon:yes gene_type:complete
MTNKIKLITIVAALISGAVSLNAAQESSFSGSASTKYTSDYARRGTLLSQDAMQAQVGFSTAVAGVDVFGDFFTNQSTSSSGGNTDEFTLGVGTSFLESLLSAYAGVYNTDHSSASDSSLEGFISVSVNTVLTPTVTLYRDTDDSLQTFEGQLSYDVDFDLAKLGIGGVLGTTDTLALKNETYTGLTVKLSKDINKEFNIFTDVSVSDSELRDNETVWGVGLNLNF